MNETRMHGLEVLAESTQRTLEGAFARASQPRGALGRAAIYGVLPAGSSRRAREAYEAVAELCVLAGQARQAARGSGERPAHLRRVAAAIPAARAQLGTVAEEMHRLAGEFTGISEEAAAKLARAADEAREAARMLGVLADGLATAAEFLGEEPVAEPPKSKRTAAA